MTAAKIVVVTGGAGSGKSAFSLAYALKLGCHRYFLACAEAADGEMAAKIAAHKKERDGAFTTIEEPIDLAAAIATIPRETEGRVLLWDCLTLWLSNCLMAGMTTDKILSRLEAVLVQLRRLGCPVVVVTNEIGMGLVPLAAESRRFRNLAGKAGQLLAAAADEAYLVVLGRAVPLATVAEIAGQSVPRHRQPREV